MLAGPFEKPRVGICGVRLVCASRAAVDGVFFLLGSEGEEGRRHRRRRRRDALIKGLIRSGAYGVRRGEDIEGPTQM